MAIYNLITAREFSRVSGLRYGVVLQMCKEGKLPRINVGRGKKDVFRVPKEQALQALEDLMLAPVITVKPDEADPTAEPERVVKVKVYRPRRMSALAPGGFNFKESLEALLV